MAKFFEADVTTTNIRGETVTKKGVLHFSSLYRNSEPLPLGSANDFVCIAEEKHLKNYSSEYKQYLESKKVPQDFPPPTDKIVLRPMTLSRAVKKALGAK